MSEFFEFILYGAMYVGIGIAVLFALAYITLELSFFLFKGDEMAATLFGILFGISSLFLIGHILGSQPIENAIYGYTSSLVLYILYLILRE